jgi:SAM-dependent methyltransferase
MTTTGYVHAGADFESEQARLALLERRYDEATFRRLRALGSLEGARCLEVGAGAGSVARWLSGQVGLRGHVVATDIDPRFLFRLGAPRVEVLRHDILVDDIEEGAYDLVHCRALLLHLPDPARALERMVTALRPGGMLLVEDADFVSMVATDPAHPMSATFDRTVRVVMAHVDELGLFDPWFGRRLPVLVAGLGVEGHGYEAIVALRQGGSPEATLLERSISRSRDRMLAANLLTDDDFDALSRATTDPSFTFFDAISVAAWGHRPGPG